VKKLRSLLFSASAIPLPTIPLTFWSPAFGTRAKQGARLKAQGYRLKFCPSGFGSEAKRSATLIERRYNFARPDLESRRFIRANSRNSRMIQPHSKGLTNSGHIRFFQMGLDKSFAM
jgi:hypothetical protein